MLGTLTPASSSPYLEQTQSMPRGESESEFGVFTIVYVLSW